MHCMKCGQEIEAGHVFCDACLTEMEKYPVKPDAVPLLPNRSASRAEKKPVPHRAVLTADEQLRRMRRKSRFLAGLLVITIVMLLGMSAAAGLLMRKLNTRSTIGRNYTIVDSNGTPATVPK